MKRISKPKENGNDLYNVINSDGYKLDVLLEKSNHPVAYAFMKKLVIHYGEPPILTINKVLKSFFHYTRPHVLIPSVLQNDYMFYSETSIHNCIDLSCNSHNFFC